MNFYKRIISFTKRNVDRVNQDKKMKSFYARIIKKDELCFDVGANTGNRTNVFLKLGTRVVSVEPQKLCSDILRKRFMSNKNFILVDQAVGSSAGETELLLSDASTLSSMSSEWISSMKASGRFGDNQWNKTQKVKVTTLDELINKYGVPAFCKIDVEGYELEVLKGLTHKINIISFEYAGEFLKSAIDCIDYIIGIDSYEFNYSAGESMEFSEEKWMNSDQIKTLILNSDKMRDFGDIYARAIKATTN